MKLEFIPIDYDYFDFQGRNFIKLVGRTADGKKICLIDSYEPNFWAILKSSLSKKKIDELIDKIKKIEIEKADRKTKIEKVELHEKNFLGKKVQALKIFAENHKDLHDVADNLGFEEIEKRREYDINLISKYIIEKKFEPLVWYDVEVEKLNEDFDNFSEGIELDCYQVKNIFEIKKQKEFVPKILAYDIETDHYEIGKGDILMISLYGVDGKKEFKKVLTWKKCSKKQDFVECFRSEEEMIKKFIEYVKDFNPDFLTGYFSDGFDLPYLRENARQNGIKLDLGLDGREPIFARGRIPSGKIFGIVHVDLFRFIDAVYSQYLQSETLGLGDVATELIGEGKIDFDIFGRLSEGMRDKDWKDFFEYNLQDSKVTFKLFEKIWADILEFSRIIKEPVFDITRDRMSAHVENFLLHNLERFNEIAEKHPTHDEIFQRRSMGKYEGAFVFQPTPGLYENIGMFDFTSMYASVIVTYNLSLSTFEGVEKNENKFSKEKGFFPKLLEEIISLRKKYKEEYSLDKNNLKKARSNAYKLLANASYGYQGFFGARYYCREAAASTAKFAKENILSAIEKIKKNNYEVIYSDTDSIAFLLNKKSKKETKEFLEKLNSQLPGIMELDLEDFYKRGLFVSKRTTEAGAKKKYALIDYEGKMKIRGFETVRRDWCNLARFLQSEILETILTDGNEKKSLKIFKEVITLLKERKIKKEDLIIRTQLKKNINDYIAEGPHVVAAKKMEEKGLPVSIGTLILYFVGDDKKGGKKSKKVGDKVFLPDENVDYDIDYYLNNQIVPAVENILEVFGVDLKSIVDGEKQEKLF